MFNGFIMMFGILLLLFVLQSIGGFFQVRDYQRAVRRVNQQGAVGIGQKRGRMLSGGHIAIIACDATGIIKAGEVLKGSTFLARFHSMRVLLDQQVIGHSIYDYLEQIRNMAPKKRKYYKGYEQALEALEHRLQHQEEGGK